MIPTSLSLQLLLATRDIAPLTLDGIIGPRTMAAVRAAASKAVLSDEVQPSPALLSWLSQQPGAPVEVGRVRTALSLDEVGQALEEGHRRIFLSDPTPARLRLARAQMVVEHGWDAHGLWDFCMGNVMTGRGYQGPWFAMTAAELHPYGWEDHRSHWRAGATPEEGAALYWDMLRRCFAGALAAMDGGTPEQVAHALKSAGYFTAAEGSYGTLLRSCWARLG